VRIEATIQGVTPLLMNRFCEQNEIKISSGTSAAMVGKKDSPREEATRRAYVDDKGGLYVPGPNVFACLVAAGKFHKVAKSKVTTTRSSLVPAGITIQDIVCPLGTKSFEVDSRSVVIPSTGGRIMCHRPRIDDWKLTFTLEVDTSIFSPEFVRQLVDDAGSKIGLGDFRPDRRGPFGRFNVVACREAS